MGASNTAGYKISKNYRDCWASQVTLPYNSPYPTSVCEISILIPQGLSPNEGSLLTIEAAS